MASIVVLTVFLGVGEETISDCQDTRGLPGGGGIGIGLDRIWIRRRMRPPSLSSSAMVVLKAALELQVLEGCKYSEVVKMKGRAAGLIIRESLLAQFREKAYKKPWPLPQWPAL